MQGEKFPWSELEWSRILGKFQTESEFEVRWWWAPFHQVGVNALTFAQARGLSEKHLDLTLKELTTPKAQKAYLDQMKAKGKSADGIVTSIDPETQIRATWSAAELELARFQPNHVHLPRISEITGFLGSNKDLWNYEITDLSSIEKLKDLESPESRVMKPWDRIQFIEIILGSAQSFTDFKFCKKTPSF